MVLPPQRLLADCFSKFCVTISLGLLIRLEQNFFFFLFSVFESLQNGHNSSSSLQHAKQGTVGMIERKQFHFFWQLLWSHPSCFCTRSSGSGILSFHALRLRVLGRFAKKNSIDY